MYLNGLCYTFNQLWWFDCLCLFLFAGAKTCGLIWNGWFCWLTVYYRLHFNASIQVWRMSVMHGRQIYNTGNLWCVYSCQINTDPFLLRLNKCRSFKMLVGCDGVLNQQRNIWNITLWSWIDPLRVKNVLLIKGETCLWITCFCPC